MNIAFRTDASSQIGSGHFMRCLALADELKLSGQQISFISRNLPSYLIELLMARGIEYRPLSAGAVQSMPDKLAHSSWLGTSQTVDAHLTVGVLSHQSFDWVVVDHYSLDQCWESIVRKACKKLMVIDDLADRKHDCDILLDQNYYPEMQHRYADKVPSHCRLLLGPTYALLREEFRIFRKQIKPRAGNVFRILVFFGGTDINNYTGFVIDALASLNINQQVDVVIGCQHPKREYIEQICLEYGYVCHVQTAHMAELMAKADLAIGAGGSASWERCCLGLPSLLLAIANNQIEIAKAINSINACVYIEINEKNILTSVQKAITDLLDAPSKIHNLSKQALSLVDGNGVFKVCKELGC